MSNYNIKALEKIESKTKIYLVIIAVLLIMLCICNTMFVIPSIIVYTLIILYTIWVYNKRKGELSSYINELTFSVDSAAKSTLINSPFPLIILETNGNVVWRSSTFNKEFANVGINAHIDELAKEINLEIQNNNYKVDKKIEIGGKIYHVIGDYVKMKKRERKKENKYMITLYFIDITDEVELINKYNNAKTCMGIVMLDNYEEIIQRISEERKPQLIAAIEKKLYEWASNANGVMIKKDRDTYVFVFEQQYLETMENTKFSILDEIKEIEAEEGMPITLTIAISNEGDSNYEKYESAMVAMDIALGRGGDQAVIRKEGKYNFFGGKTQEVEKRTKVKARVISHALEELIQKAENVIIMGHLNGDIDSLGSSLGIYRLAKTLEKEAYIVNNTYGLSLENFVNTLRQEGYNDVILDKNQAINMINENTVLIVVDTHKRSYVEVPELLEKTEKVVVIDHHRKSEDFIENAILTFHEAYASSASELVTEIVEYATTEVQLEQIEAESLYAGIMMDTKNFTFKTGVRTFEAAAYLRKYGIDIIKVKKWFQSDLESYSVIADIVKKAEIVNDSIGISTYNDEKDKNSNLICAKAADELLTISDITASFVLGHMGEKICISGRSIGDINVQVIMEKMGGGGHITLAGAQIEGLTMEEAKTELIIRINEYFTENNF